MKFICSLTIVFGCFQMLFAQGEGVYPLSRNPDLYNSTATEMRLKSGPLSFDSTFIYTTDTLEVSLNKSFLDEFSHDHFQKYFPDYSSPNVTFDKRYKLLNKNNNLPLPNTVKYSNIPTVRKKINLAQGTVMNEALPKDTILVGDFRTYPPVYTTTFVYPPYNILDTIDFPNDPDTIMVDMPFFVQDSATQFFSHVQDQNAYWIDNYAYHNYRFAKNPWTLGVVTFDGIDQNGFPYNFGSTARGQADVLHSKPIDMSSLNGGNEVYFSFLYQTEGYGDQPKITDSLVLEFYAPTIQQWFRVWSIKGAPVSDFKKAHIKVQDPKYFQNAFQFRFTSYGELSGSLDHFHVDYVHLRASSGPQDTLFKDFAFVYPTGSFLKDYTSVPWDHYKESPLGKMNNRTQINVRNGSNITENSQNGSAWVKYNNVTEGTFVLSNYELTNHDPAQNYAPLSFFESFHDFSNGYRFDENKPGIQQVFDTYAAATVQFPQLTVNDSTSGKQVFSNYYAYDDGSAEKVYGLDGAQSMLAYKFTPYPVASPELIGVKMSFIPSVQNVSNHLFLLTVWNDNNGIPGSKIYEDQFFFPRQPIYSDQRNNQFVDYYLKDTMKLPIDGTFYVGWRQLEGDKLCIGLDMNTNNSDKIFYSLNNGHTWINTQYQASLLMRPIFSTSMDASLGIEGKKQETVSFDVYPNPTNGVLNIRTNAINYQGVVLFDLQGKLLMQTDTNETQLNVDHLNPGIYIVRDINSGITRKIVKN